MTKAREFKKGQQGVCRHCERVRVIHGRGLCQTCWRKPNIRNRYRARQSGGGRRQPTMAELDALIARQMEDLPEWWSKETPNS